MSIDLARQFQSGCVVVYLALVACTPPTNTAKAPEAATSSSATAQNQAAVSPNTKPGVDALQANNYAKAKEFLTLARNETPQDPYVHLYLGIAEMELGNKPEAVKCLRDALQLAPKLTEASINLSALLLDSRKPEDAAEAVKVTEAGLKHTPDSPELVANHAVALADSADYAAASVAYEKLVKKAPEDLKLRYDYAVILAKLGQNDKALAELEHVGKSTNPKLLAAAGNLHSQLGSYQTCVALLDKVAEKQPEPELLVRRANCKKELHDYKGERADLEQAVKLDAKFAAAHLGLGRHLFYVAKKNTDAIAELERAKELSPGTPVADEAEKTIALIKQPKPRK